MTLSAKKTLPRVLVVDDEPLVGRAVTRALSSGAEVVCVTSGREGIALVAEGAAGFDLILCDLMMPDMSGAEFRAALLRVRPELERRLVYITGGAFTDEMEQFLRQTDLPHLLKPFDVPRLRGLVASLAAPV